MPRQLALPLETRPALARGDFLVAPANETAVRFIDRWPQWPVPVAVLFGPAGSGKSHLVEAWSVMSGAQVFRAASLPVEASLALAIEDVDHAPASEARDRALLALLDGAGSGQPRALLLTGRTAPNTWSVSIEDLKSRLAAVLAFPLWAPDDQLLGALTRKLFADRQLQVTDAVVTRILRALERTPAAIHAFVAEADAQALAERRPISERLVSELLSGREQA